MVLYAATVVIVVLGTLVIFTFNPCPGQRRQPTGASSARRRSGSLYRRGAGRAATRVQQRSPRSGTISRLTQF